MTLDKNHLHQIEHNISPPMRRVITIPVELDKGKRAVIYVAQGGFAALNAPITDKELLKIAERVALLSDEQVEQIAKDKDREAEELGPNNCGM